MLLKDPPTKVGGSLRKAYKLPWKPLLTVIGAKYLLIISVGLPN
jgi:hypothetical protein